MKDIVRKSIWGMTVITVVVGFIIAPAIAKKVDIKMMVCGWAMEDGMDPVTGRTYKGYQHMVDKFNKENPDINLTVVSTPWGDLIGPFVKHTSALIAGTADIVQARPYWARKGLYESLDPYIQRDNYPLTDFREDYLVPAYNKAPGDTEEHLYSFPSYIDAFVIAYDKEIFDHYGVDYLSKFPTLDELKEKGLAMTGTDPVTGMETYGFFFRGCYIEWQYMSYVRALGGNVFAGPKATNLDSKPCIDALQWLIDMAEAGTPGPVFMTAWTPPGWLTVDNQYAIKAEEGPAITWLTLERDLTDRIGVSCYVQNPEGRGGVMGGADMGIAISQKSKHKDEAWEVMKFWMSSEAQRFAFENQRMLSIRKEVDEWAAASKLPYWDVIAEQLNRADTEIGFVHEVLEVARMIIRSTVQEALAGDLSAEEACKAMQEEIMQKMAERG